MHGVAPEVTQEIAVFLEYERLDSGPCQQQAGHHAGRTASGDAAAGGDSGHDAG
jgi:hypothetical protein